MHDNPLYAVIVLAMLLPLCQLSLASPAIVEDDIIRTPVAISRHKIKHIGVQKYVGRVQKSKHTQQRHSSFYIELYGHTWVNFIEITQ